MADLAECNFQAVLASATARTLFTDAAEKEAEGGERSIAGAQATYRTWPTVGRDILRRVECYVSAQQGSAAVRLAQTTIVGIAALCAFMRDNWTGPWAPLVLGHAVRTDETPDASSADTQAAAAEALDALQCDGETAYTKARHPAYLIAARTLLVDAPPSDLLVGHAHGRSCMRSRRCCAGDA